MANKKSKKIEEVPYPEGVPCPPPKIQISFDGVLKNPLDGRLAFLMQLHGDALDLEIQVSDLADMTEDEKWMWLNTIETKLGIPELLRELNRFKKEKG